jgi:murein DD-endopeptidase MepM/ murein hydrolase activator NlpD
VVGTAGSRTIQWGAGPEAVAYSRDDQPSDDPERANRSGWDCRVHVEYEGQPAVDWYVPVGTPVRATMAGTATLYVVTVTNAFDYYGVAREPYIGNPDRTRAPLSPFPGPGGGKGVFIRVENEGCVTEYAHLDVARTVAPLAASVFLSGYSSDYDYAGIFAPLRDFRVSTAIAQWTVKSGDVIGFSGDSGYSEAPHLHYTVGRSGAASLLCPTAEAGFADGGWLMKASALGGGCSNCPLY